MIIFSSLLENELGWENAVRLALSSGGENTEWGKEELGERPEYSRWKAHHKLPRRTRDFLKSFIRYGKQRRKAMEKDMKFYLQLC